MAKPGTVYVYPNGATVSPTSMSTYYIGQTALTMPDPTHIPVYDEPTNLLLDYFSFSYSGYTFKEWNTAADGTGTSYSIGDSVTGSGYKYMYAIWEEAIPPVSIKLGNTEIASLSDSGMEVLETSGTYLTDDITVEYIKPTPNLQSKTASPTTSSQTITADSGYDGLSQVTVNAISPTKSAQTYTPTTTDQTIQSGRWLTGAQTIKGDANLVASNIKKDVQIFGVTGSYEGSGGGGAASFIENHGTMTSYEDSTITVIGQGAFAWCGSLQTVSFPSCTTIGDRAFYQCSSLTTASFPVCTSIGGYAFQSCISLTTASFPVCTSIGGYAFASCFSLRTASFPACTSIGSYAFYQCSYLTEASFPACTKIDRNAFYSCSRLSSANFSVCETISDSAFYNCRILSTVIFPSCSLISWTAFGGCPSLRTISFPACKIIGIAAFGNCLSLSNMSFPVCSTISTSAFNNCTFLPTASFPACVTIHSQAFSKCYRLVSLYLLGSSIVSLLNSNAFYSTPIGGYTGATSGAYGSIYVPSSLLASYKTATNWTYFSDRFVGI